MYMIYTSLHKYKIPHPHKFSVIQLQCSLLDNRVLHALIRDLINIKEYEYSIITAMLLADYFTTSDNWVIAPEWNGWYEEDNKGYLCKPDYCMFQITIDQTGKLCNHELPFVTLEVKKADSMAWSQIMIQVRRQGKAFYNRETNLLFAIVVRSFKISFFISDNNNTPVYPRGIYTNFTPINLDRFTFEELEQRGA